MKDQQQHSQNVRLEDLLRLKRAERPSAEFWVQFEESLRKKQLAAIVEKRSWWRVQSLFSHRARWFTLSASAASLALVAVVVNHSVRSFPSHVAKTEVSAAPTVVAQVAVAAPETPVARKPSSVSKISMPDASTVLAGFDAQKAKAPSLSASLDIGPVAHQDETVVLTSVSMDATQATEAIAETPGQDSHRARLMAYADSSLGAVSEASSRIARSRERMVSRLSDQALYDTISRLDVGGNHLSIKF